MPLFGLAGGRLCPFRLLKGGSELYEHEIETLLWANLEDLLGEPLFPIGRQVTLPGGGRPDIVALDKVGRVVVIEVKRGIDRSQLSQCLEYAGWARQANLDEIASQYFRGSASFFADWQEFTESATPVVINRNPRLMLVAKDVHIRTQQALEFLIENGLPASFVPVAIYEGHNNERYVDVGREAEYEAASVSNDHVQNAPKDSNTVGVATKTTWRVNGRRFRLGDLLEVGLLQSGDELTWERPNKGGRHVARVSEDGGIVLADGNEYASPSAAAVAVAGNPVGGWEAWRVTRHGGRLLKELRTDAIARPAEGD